MSRHPMEHRWSRRQFMRRAGGAAIALPTMSAILAACSKPGTTSSGGSGSAGGERVLARPDNPVTLPLNGEPIPADTPIEAGATLQVYNWDAYMYKKVLKDFEDKFGVTVEWTTFNNMEEGIQKLVSGQVKPDVFFPTTDYISRLVEKDLLQPLQHALIPNMESNVWPSFSDPGPWYDTGWQYTVPYTIYTTGVAYRRDRVEDVARRPEGVRPPLERRLLGRDQLLRLVPRRDRDVLDPQREHGSEHRRRRRDHRCEGRDHAAPERLRRPPHDQRHLREAPRGRVHRVAGLVRRHRGREVVPAEGHLRGRPRVLVPRRQGGPDRQRLHRDPDHRAEPAPRARIPELLPRRDVRLRELRELERVSATVHLDRSRQADRRQGRSRRRSTMPSSRRRCSRRA